MREIGVLEARNHFAKLLVAVEAGETVVVTRRGKPVARLGPVRVDQADQQARRLAALELRGSRTAYRLNGLDWRLLKQEGLR